MYAYQSAMEFDALCKSKNAEILDLDAWMVAFTKWILHPKFLLDGIAKVAAAVAQRNKLAADAGLTAKFWCPNNLKSVVNGMAHFYKQTKPAIGIVPSVSQQFPDFNLAFNAACARDKCDRAMLEPLRVLQDREVEFLCDQTNWWNLLEAQRMNLLLIGYSLGQRPENLAALFVGNGHILKDEDSDPVLEVAFGHMKNKPCNLATAGAAVFRQRILMHPN